MIDLLAPDPAPSGADLASWRAAALTGDGSPWLNDDEALALGRHALMHGEGVSLMEAIAPRFREPPRDVDWEILGNDPAGQNWSDHFDPQRSFALLRAQLTRARRDGVRLKYKLWLARPPR